MKKQLKVDDRRAMDFLLERSGPASGFMLTPPPAEFPQRIKAAEKMLRLLDNLPEVEAPADLVARTMKRVEDVELHGASLPPPRPNVDPSRPLA